VDLARVAELERRLGHRFRDRGLLEQACTHASYANEHPPTASHEGLALLGDAALALERLARWARELDLGPLLRLGRGEEQTGGRARESILASALEALLGAIYLEDGIAAVRASVGRLALW